MKEKEVVVGGGGGCGIDRKTTLYKEGVMRDS